MESLPIFYTSWLAILTIIILGFILGKLKIVNANASKVLANLLLDVAMPCALFIAFPSSFDAQALDLFLKAIVGGLAMMLTAIVVSRFLFKPNKNRYPYYQHQFAFIFNNASFLGYPLTLAIFGPESMIAYSGLMIVFNLALFSYGVWLFEQQLTWKHIKQIFFNPNILAVLLGLIFFLNSFSLSLFAQQAIGYLANLTTPLSLIVVGFMLSQVPNLWLIIKKKRIFITAALQLLLMPALTYLVMRLLQMPTQICQIFTMIQALPTATSLALFAEKYHGDRQDASELVLMSTILSALTLPLVMTVVFLI
ncbi:MAG: AEC family transporter [bacterium]|nr:AEC family transporter [bacterium]